MFGLNVYLVLVFARMIMPRNIGHILRGIFMHFSSLGERKNLCIKYRRYHYIHRRTRIAVPGQHTLTPHYLDCTGHLS